jgi:hypothetical protein
MIEKIKETNPPRGLARLMSYRLDGSPEDICALGEILTMVAFQPIGQVV